jgi:hypothetical protein
VIVLLCYFTYKAATLSIPTETKDFSKEVHAIMEILTDRIIFITVIPALIALFSLFSLYRYVAPGRRAFHAPLLEAGNTSVESFHPALAENYRKVSRASSSIEAVCCTRVTD